jgi:DNA-binding NtrC family response regulator
VIEDADVHLSILRKIGAQAGFATTGVNSLNGAANVLRRRSFDCITLDLDLGEASGNDVMQLMSDLRCEAPLLIISGAEDQARDVASRAGKILGLNVLPPLAKPVELRRLRESLQKIHGEARKLGRLARNPPG